MSTLTVDIKGLDKAFAELNLITKEATQKTQLALNAWAIETSSEAKTLAPIDEGHLRGSINPKYGELEASVTVATDYAAYVEFGTRKYAASYVNSLPDNWQDLAAKYKGSGGGSFAEMVERLKRWCKVKGLPDNAAYAVAKKILINGVKPQPYLYPASQNAMPKLIERLKKIFE